MYRLGFRMFLHFCVSFMFSWFGAMQNTSLEKFTQVFDACLLEYVTDGSL